MNLLTIKILWEILNHQIKLPRAGRITSAGTTRMPDDSKTERMFARVFALLMAAANAAGCAGSPAMLSRMNSSEIQHTDDTHLCRAYAFYKADKETSPVIEAEVARRRLSCAAELDARVSDCTILRILSAGPHPSYSNVTLVTVQNSSQKQKAFRINMGNISSTTFRLAPGATQTYGIAVPKEVGAVAGVFGAVQGTTSQTPELYNCVTLTQ